MSVCWSCGAPILWARTEHDESIPLDPAPKAGGSIRLDAGVAIVVPQAEREGELYLSHFATCPDADRHRRTRR
jgi:hypothetical protein